MNLRMPDLRRAFAAAGFADVQTLLSSGNVLFSARATSESALERRAEAAMLKSLGREFFTIVRPVGALRSLVARDPYAPFRVHADAKRIVTFLRKRPVSTPALPIEQHGARILTVTGREVLSAYRRTPKGPVFMTLIERAFGKEQTTRTWDTVAKLATSG
jgi:uncharacterized protein (DUF1697 family)